VLTLFKLGNIQVRQAELFGEIDIAYVEGSEPYVADASALDEGAQDFV
jgi:segregation and condensation protein A